MILALFLLFSNVTCASTKEATAVRIQIGAEPKSLDPVQATDALGFGIMSNVVTSLKDLAKKVEVSKDKLKYTIKIRSDAKWSDGQDVTIEECERGLFNVLNPQSHAPDAQLLFSIKNAHDYFLGKKEKEEVGIKIQNSTLVIEVERPDPAFLLVLSTPMTGPQRIDFVGPWEPGRPTTGRYFISSYAPGKEIRLEPNPFNNIPGQLPIEYKIVTEETAAQNLFDKGKIDIMTVVTPTEVERLRKANVIKQFPSASSGFIAFNSQKPPFNNPIWRKAVFGAIDRAGLNKVISATTKPNLSLLPSTLDGALSVDPSLFKKEVEKVAAIKNKPRVKIEYMQSLLGNLAMQKIQSDLKKNLNLEVDLQPMEWKSFLGDLKTEGAPIYFMAVTAFYNDPTNHLYHFIGDAKDGNNFSRYENPDYLAAVRSNDTSRAQKILIEQDTIAVPLYEKLQTYAVSGSIRNFRVSPYMVIALQDLRKSL